MRKTENTVLAGRFLTDLDHDAGTHGNCSDKEWERNKAKTRESALERLAVPKHLAGCSRLVCMWCIYAKGRSQNKFDKFSFTFWTYRILWPGRGLLEYILHKSLLRECLVATVGSPCKQCQTVECVTPIFHLSPWLCLFSLFNYEYWI